ncbi:class I adenylate-forming enzyme family protein [Sphingomonas sp. KR1UV-12]|uniref:Class I adenylate-forming enzyme family protein n=1 Tax=Sphingomonas aurea TaxID=3063994 RepID=A0ABT9ELX8_9SPHN|nr:class I adenylate-forming enzyme family protein [Sphingomonas sp. KR1UV-12]MDP1027962.1 class I adenylate-forming enzyme family protein [Sphingomonas sp. KR1UV-12]
MRTELDRRMDDTIAGLTAAGGMLATGGVERWGTTLPMIAAAPPSLPAYFAHYCTQHRDLEFLVAGEERLTFGAVYTAADRVARALVGRGIGRGDRVGIAARNSPSWIVTYMAVLMAGGVATLLNGWWQAEELAAAIADVDCALIVADGPRAARLAQIPGLTTPVVAIDDTLPLDQATAPLLTGEAGDLPQVGPDDLATILFTSGSTGQSKGALSDHRAVIAGTFSFLSQALTMLTISTQDGVAPPTQHVTLLTIPLFHVTAEVPVFLQSFAIGRRLVIIPKWDAREAMRLIERERVTYFIGVPLMSFEILNHPDRGDYDLSSVSDFGAGGAPRPVEHVRRIDAEMGGPAPLIGYGLTETNAVGTGNWRSNYIAKPDSCGRPSKPLVEVAILDDAGTHLAQGQRGEIGIRSIANFRGYWNRPAATEAAFTADGFFRSGDIGYLDADGYLFIVDRKKDIIIRGGENISCQEVEAALYTHPAVKEAAVFGLADERLGEVPVAVVHLDADVGEEALRTYLADHIAAFKVPTRIWIADAPLPRLGTEKIDKVGLKAAYRALAVAA